MSESQNGRSAAEMRAAEILLSGALRPPASSDSCPSAEALAAFVDGRGTPAERAVLAEHIETCEACSAVVAGVAEVAGEFSQVVAPPLPGTMRRRPFAEWMGRHRAASISALAAAAALVLAVWVGGRWFSSEARLDRALAQMDSSLGEYRPTEPRLTGAQYRQKPPVTRAAASNVGAPLEVREWETPIERAALGTTPETRARAMAKMNLMLGKPDAAVDAVAAFVGSSRDAGLLSDAAAAYLVRGRDSDYAQALDAADRAVKIEPRLASAWFNYGLAAEALGQHPIAAQAWDQVIALEPNSGWAREAAERKAKAPKRQSWQPQDEAEFLAAVERGDDEAASGVAGRSLMDARLYFERSILPAVGERWLAGDRGALTAVVARAVVAARALDRLSADRWARDVALQLRSMVDRGDAGTARSACIPAALDAVRLRSLDQIPPAAARLTQARPCRSAIHDALAAHEAYVRLRDAANAERPPVDLAQQVAEVARVAGAREYFSLQGRALWLEGILLARQAKYVDALDRYAAAEIASQRGRDDDAVVTVAALIAEVYQFLGARETAWREGSRALTRVHAIGSTQRRHTVYRSAIRQCVERSLYSAALRLYDAAFLDLQGEADVRLVLLSDRAPLLAHLNRLDEARADVKSAFDLLPQTGASAPVEAFRKVVLRSQALVALRADPATATQVLTELIDTTDPTFTAFGRAELFFLRAGSYAEQSNLDLADVDFRSGFDLVEQRQENLPDHLRPAAFDRTWDAVAAAIKLHAVTRNDPWSGLRLAERARAAALTARVSDSNPFEDVEVFRRNLPPGVIVVFLSVMNDAVLSWALTNADRSFRLEPIPYADLTDLATRFRTELEFGTRQSYEPLARRLYQIVLSAHPKNLLSGASTLVVVPDGPLLGAPFAALVGPSGRFLIEDVTVLVAPNLRLFRTLSSRLGHRNESPSAVAIGDPAFGSPLPWPLPRLAGAGEEARRVADTYGGATLVGTLATKPAFLHALQHNDVIHFAGHAVVNTARPDSSSLVLAPSEGDAGLLFPAEIDRTPISPGALVVLAACDTAEGGIFRGEGLMGLVRPFIAAGAASVVANLWPVDDTATVDFSKAFHGGIKAGLSPGAALQRAQSSFASRREPPRLWAGWLVVGGHR